MKENFGLAINSYLELNEISSIKAELSDDRLFNLPFETLIVLLSKKIINNEDISQASNYHSETILESMKEGFKKYNEKDYVSALSEFNKATSSIEIAADYFIKDIENKEEVTLHLTNSVIYLGKARTEKKLEDFDSAIKTYDKVIEIVSRILKTNQDFQISSLKTESNPPSAESLLMESYWERSEIFLNLKQLDKATEEIEKAIRIFTKLLEKEYSSELCERLAVCLRLKARILITNENMQDFVDATDKLIELYEDLTERKYKENQMRAETIKMLSTKISFFIFTSELDKAISPFIKYIVALKKNSPRNWIEEASKKLIEIGGLSEFPSVQKLIFQAKFEKEFSHLILAIDYLETKDETLIEKLSPEVRIVVEETIKTLQMIEEGKSESETDQKKKNKKDRASEKSLALSK